MVIRPASKYQIPIIERDGVLPLSFSQRRLWFLSRIDGVSQAYNISVGFELKGALNQPALHQALKYIVIRHESFRARFGFVDDEPIQKNRSTST